MKVLGIDPGVGRLGWGVVASQGTSYSLIDCGCLETTKNTALPARLVTISIFLKDLIEVHAPDQIAVESLFFEKNAKTAMDVAAARGVILLAGELSRLPIFQYTPLQVKSSLTGYGKADKSQVEFMVKKILHLKDKIRPDDASDAVAIALAHIFRT